MSKYLSGSFDFSPQITNIATELKAQMNSQPHIDKSAEGAACGFAAQEKFIFGTERKAFAMR